MTKKEIISTIVMGVAVAIIVGIVGACITNICLKNLSEIYDKHFSKYAYYYARMLGASNDAEYNIYHLGYEYYLNMCSKIFSEFEASSLAFLF